MMPRRSCGMTLKRAVSLSERLLLLLLPLEAPALVLLLLLSAPALLVTFLLARARSLLLAAMREGLRRFLPRITA